ncbi:MAG TPA: glycosyl hydrolase family 8 [Thermomicrobiales bacterium]|nr:glycosyl hydrolase family 8 [Thermomicrobiales bacterium]
MRSTRYEVRGTAYSAEVAPRERVSHLSLLISRFRTERALVAGLVLVGLVAQGLNMFNNPGFAGLGDEGIYTSQAWAVLREGRLAPYTYFYDHAPAGWILLAGWMGLTGGPFTFGDAIDSGRVLMLLLHLAMVVWLYRLARRLGCGAPTAALATLLFSLSPLALFYQRLVLLDTIMLFWALLSLDLLLDGRGRLSRVALSGVCFGLAFLSKETAVVMLPAFLLIAVMQRRRHQGRFAVGGWLLPMALVASLYPLYAALKGELLPAGEAAYLAIVGGGTNAHVSLLEALKWQASRGGGGAFNLDNQFWQFVRGDWLPRDPVLFVGGAAASIVNLLRGVAPGRFRDRRALVAGALGLLPLAYLARGGVVLVFYVLDVIPFFCLNLALLFEPRLRRPPARAAAPLALALPVALVGGYAQAGTLQPLFTARPALAARESVAWVKAHVPSQSLIVTHDDPWTDLHEPGLGGPAFPNVHNHWKVALDPAIRDGVFHDDWRTVDYVIMLPGIEGIFRETDNTVTLGALQHAHLVRRWQADGDTIELWKVDKVGATEQALLQGSDAYITGHFARGGAYATSDGTVTSEAQSYAMLRAVWSGDRPAFDRAWAWTRDHLVTPAGLPAWQWRDGRVTDPHSATDADTDTALALLLASKRWDDPRLRDAGARMVAAIWAHDVTTVDGAPYVAAGNWATSGPVVALNPSYFAPYAYHVFKDVDPGHDWLGAVDSSYRVLFAATSAPLAGGKPAGLPPDWVGLDRASGRLAPLRSTQGDTTRYGYDAARVYWRVALDLRWTGDGRAAAYLRQAGFLREEVRRQGFPYAVYGHDGAPVERAPSLTGDAGALAALLTLDPDAANTLYAGQIVGGATNAADPGGPVYWSNRDDLYAQEWGWFATALYADALPDLWRR